MDNTIMLIGNVTGDVDLVKTPGGSKVVNFSIAVTKYYDKENKKWIADFFDCVAWNSLAENIASSIKKGTRVIISGKLENNTWTDEEKKIRKSTRVNVSNIGPDLKFAVCSEIKKVKKDNEEEPAGEEDFAEKDSSRYQ